MAQCPKCQSSNVVVTEEVYVRKGRAYYRFWQFIVVATIVFIGVTTGEIGLGILGALIGGVIVSIFSLINASKKSNSRTKISCLSCKEKTYL